MPVLKPTRGLQLNKSHPLARGLVGCWLMNEGSGDKIFDLSGNGNTGTLVADTHFVPGKFGSALEFDGAGDYVNAGSSLGLTSAITVSAWVNFNLLDSHSYFVAEDDTTNRNWAFYLMNENTLRFFLFTGGVVKIKDVLWVPNTGQLYHVVATANGSNIRTYIDGAEVGTPFGYTGNIDTDAANLEIGRQGNGGRYFNGTLDDVMIYNRALSASEIALLYREPFCIFARAGRSELIGGQIVNLAGTSAALSSLSATAKAMRKVGGNVASISDVEALLNSIRGRLETERNWLREALFNGMTANAFKLGTTLSLGWFWVRIAGCSVLYRGSGMEEIDFVNILAVAEQDACETSPPSYIPHNSGSTYFYVIRRFNNCGYQEHTLAAAVKVSIESNGELAEPQPNKVFDSGAELVDGNKIQLVWFYCPLAQKLQPVCFNVYYDNRTGQINYQNPLATISYKGRKFYSFQSSTLEAGKYLFAIRAEDAGGIENSSLARLRIQLDTAGPEAVDILRAEAV